MAILLNKKERSIFPKLEICLGREAATKILATQLGRKKTIRWHVEKPDKIHKEGTGFPWRNTL